jgi:hypothetical protein
LPGRPVDPDTTGGYYQPVTAWLDGAFSIGNARLSCGLTSANRKQLLAYNEQYRANENPLIARVELSDGTALEPVGDDPSSATATVLPASQVTLRAIWNECPAEASCGDMVCSAFEDRANCPADCEVPRGCAGREPYVAFDTETGTVNQRHEALRVAWYASAGSFETELTGSEEGEVTLDTTNVWSAPATETSATIWLVLRDSRGGSSWRSYQLEVRP